MVNTQEFRCLFLQVHVYQLYAKCSTDCRWGGGAGGGGLVVITFTLLVLPLLYWTSKQHKCPYKFRFIAGASKCYNKQLAIDLSLALKCIKKHFKNYCKVIQKRTGISDYWSKDNSYEFINIIADIKTAHSIKTFDFSTLYTNLPLDVIYDSLRSLIIKMFVNSNSVAIMVDSNKRAL